MRKGKGYLEVLEVGKVVAGGLFDGEATRVVSDIRDGTLDGFVVGEDFIIKARRPERGGCGVMGEGA